MPSDVLKIYDGVGDKNAVFFQWLSSALGGFIIGFVYSWRLSLVILATAPLLGVAGAIMSKVMLLFEGVLCNSSCQLFAMDKKEVQS